MKLHFMGTRANTEAHSEKYQQRTLLVVISETTTLWLDCAQTWRDHIDDIPHHPDAICITHAHDDHAGGLRDGTPAPVYASDTTWEHIHTYDIPHDKRHTVSMQEPFTVGNITVTPYNVLHSIHAPANAYKVSTSDCTILYSSDIAGIDDAQAMFADVDIYIGDGSIVRRTMLLRKKDGKPVGHAPIEQQIQWCSEYGIQHAIFMHCGAEIINQDFDIARRTIQDLGKQYNVYATIAYDGWKTQCQNVLQHDPTNTR